MTERAILELGSSAMRLVVGSINDAGRLQVSHKWSRHLRLGEAVFAHGSIPPELLEELNRMLSGLREDLMQAHPGVSVQAYATSAVRDAGNRGDVEALTSVLSDQPLRILSGSEEARALLEGVRHHYDLRQTDAVLADLGGGSLELTCLRDGVVLAQYSLDCGTLRQGSCGRTLSERLRALPESAQQPVPELLLTGGNAKVLGTLLPELLGSEEVQVQGEMEVVVSGEAFLKGQSALQPTTPQERMERWSLRPHQSQVLTPALEIFGELVTFFQPQRVRMLSMALKEALFFWEEGDPVR